MSAARDSSPDGKAATTARTWPQLVYIARRGPILRPSSLDEGVCGLDVTAGCIHDCAYCHIRGAARYPGDGRVLFDPLVSDRLESVLEAARPAPRRVILSPLSDPLPPRREVRAETLRIVNVLLRRGIEVLIMTRGRFPSALIRVLAEHRARAQVALGLMTQDRDLSRTLEPWAAKPSARLRDIKRLVDAGVTVEVRLEPLIAGLTDTAENLRPLFASLAEAGATRIVAHYLFLHQSMLESLEQALAPLGWADRLRESYDEGRVFTLGSLGSTKHLPLDTRRVGLARLSSWGAEFGLSVETGAAQNPDLPRVERMPAEAFARGPADGSIRERPTTAPGPAPG